MHPPNKTVKKTNVMKTDSNDFFITSSPYDVIEQDAGNY
jgi:hypothetical protein